MSTSIPKCDVLGAFDMSSIHRRRIPSGRIAVSCLTDGLGPLTASRGSHSPCTHAVSELKNTFAKLIQGTHMNKSIPLLAMAGVVATVTATAQTREEEGAAPSLEEVVVTGTSIRGTAPIGTQLVT